jgi:hypothetical protein
MAAVYKINDDFCDDSFVLMALHSSLEDYGLVYAINRHLASGFKRLRSNFELGEYSSFPMFEWQDDLNDNYWVLIANHSTKQEMLNSNDLFQNEPTLSVPRLIPELKEVDYFLKIENGEHLEKSELLKKLQAIPTIMVAYEVMTNKLKSKNNLIF